MSTQGLPPGQPSPGGPQAALIQQITAAYFQGPLPLPEILDGYEQVLPGAADRVFTLAENEAKHRHWVDRSFVIFRFATLVVATVVAMTAIIGGIYLIATGKSATGLGVILADLVSVLTVFLVRQFTQANGNGA